MCKTKKSPRTFEAVFVMFIMSCLVASALIMFGLFAGILRFGQVTVSEPHLWILIPELIIAGLAYFAGFYYYVRVLPRMVLTGSVKRSYTKEEKKDG